MATKKNYETNGKEYYRIRRTIDGKRKAFYGSSKGDAERQYKEYLEQLAKDNGIEPDKASFHDRANEYIENTLKVSQKYAKGTIDRYVWEYERHIKGTKLDRMLIKNIRPATIQKFYNDLDVSQHSLKELNKFMSGFCKWLQRNGYADNFLSAVELPKKEDTSRKNEIIIWEEDEIRSIINGMDAERLKSPHRQDFLVRLLLYSGMRISEALGLKYTDIEDGIIHIDRQWYMDELKPPKWNSSRIVPMHNDIISDYEFHKEWHSKEMQKNGYETDFVFTTSTGSLYHSASVRKALKRFYDKYNISCKNLHTYRSTFCTQLCRCGVPLEVASKLLGHKSLEVTAAHYALIRQDSMRDAIDKLVY